jgi:hypothetical protein
MVRQSDGQPEQALSSAASARLAQLPRVARGLALAGTVCIFGGEAFCVFGPMDHQRAVHVVCHAIFYGGIALVSASAAIYWAGRRDRRNRPVHSR